MNKNKLLTLTVQNARNVSTSALLHQKSHYETLGIERGASQADIKSAFYKLSKKHHPDANVNDPTATSKFQEIAEAYEILGNEDARTRYDKGMGSIPGMKGKRAAAPGFKTADDPRAAFYKSRLANKMNSPTVGKMYNFDAWTQEHYSQSVVSNRRIREEMSQRTTDLSSKKDNFKSYDKSLTAQNKIATYLVGIILIAVAILEFQKNDVPQPVKSVHPK